MQKTFSEWNLRLFDEGAEAAPSGDKSSAVAGQIEVLRGLGVPEEDLEAMRAENPEAPSVPEEDGAQDASAQSEDTESQEQDSDGAWNRILDNPDFNRRIQDIVSARVSKLKGRLDAITPALEILGHSYGMDVTDMGAFDYEGFARKVSEDDSLFQKSAEAIVPDAGLARRIFNAELQEKRSAAASADRVLREHYDRLKSQAAAYAAVNPDFSFAEEMGNPVFANLVGPDIGMTVEQAYSALHFKDILEKKVREATEAVAQSVRAGRSFPSENGNVRRSSVAYALKPVEEMSPAEFSEYEKLLMAGRIHY